MKYDVSDELFHQVKSELQITFTERDDSLKRLSSVVWRLSLVELDHLALLVILKQN